MYVLSVVSGFNAAHRLKGYSGNCASLHGHNWKVKFCFESDGLNKIGLAEDFRVLKKKTKRILSRFDHKNLNVLREFRTKNPSSENIAETLFNRTKAEIEKSGLRLKSVEVFESEDVSVNYSA